MPCPVSWCLGQVSLSQSEARDDGQWPMRGLLCSSLVLWWHHQHWRWDTQSAAAVLLLLGAVGSGAARPPLLLVLLSVPCDPLRCQHHHHHTSDHPSWLVTLVTWHEPVWRTCHVPRDRHVTVMRPGGGEDHPPWPNRPSMVSNERFLFIYTWHNKCINTSFWHQTGQIEADRQHCTALSMPWKAFIIKFIPSPHTKHSRRVWNA